MSAEMDALLQDSTAKLEALEKAMYEVGLINAVHTSDDGLVEATADGHGALIGLWLADSITQRTAKEVGEMVVAASRKAVAEAGRQRSAIFAELNAGYTGSA